MTFHEKSFNTLFNVYIKDNYRRCTDPWYMDKLYIFLEDVAGKRRDNKKLLAIKESKIKNEEKKNFLLTKFPNIYKKRPV
jgi:hypothetical protein